MSIKKTQDYLNQLIPETNHDKIIICVENLNDFYKIDRPEKEMIEKLIINNNNVYFTYDVGHEIVDYGLITNLNPPMLFKIKNIHIHSHTASGIDHQPIYKKDKYWNEIMKGIIFLINNDYQGNIVFEYDLYKCHGETIEEKIQDYLKSIDMISEKMYRKRNNNE